LKKKLTKKQFQKSNQKQKPKKRKAKSGLAHSFLHVGGPGHVFFLTYFEIYVARG